jgi:hypothetical protein
LQLSLNSCFIIWSFEVNIGLTSKSSIRSFSSLPCIYVCCVT